MTKNRWKGSMKAIENHIDPGKEEQMKHIKTEAKSQAKKILKLAKNINPGNKDGTLKKKAELINLIEDFHQQHESLYSLYEDLRLEVKKNINLGDDDSSTEESNVKSRKHIARTSASETSDFLKDKLTSASEVKKANKPSENQEILKDLKIEEKESKNLARIRDLEQEVESLKLESSKLSTQKKDLEQQVECKLNEALQMKDKISKMEAQILEIESKYKENESQFCSLIKQFELKEQDYLSSISELVTQAENLQHGLDSSRIYNQIKSSTKVLEKETMMEPEKEMAKIVEENKNLRENVERAEVGIESTMHSRSLKFEEYSSNDVQIREKLCEMEKLVKEKEEEMLGLKEEKREAIRQLCVSIDFHRCQSDHYKKLLSEMNARRKKSS